MLFVVFSKSCRFFPVIVDIFILRRETWQENPPTANTNPTNIFGISQTLGGLMDKTPTQNFKTSSTGCILHKLLCGYGRENSFDSGEYRYVYRYLQTASTTSSHHQCHGFTNGSFLWPPHLSIVDHSAVFSACMRMQLRILKHMLNLQPYQCIHFSS